MEEVVVAHWETVRDDRDWDCDNRSDRRGKVSVEEEEGDTMGVLLLG